ncbi:MAG: HAD family hydrolase [Carboxydocellales bacterium]
MYGNSKNRLRAFIFDLDDTLYDEESFVYSGFMSVANFLQAYLHLTLDEIHTNLIQTLNEQGRGKTFDLVIEKLLLPNSLVPEMIRVYREHDPLIKIYPDALFLLNFLKGRFQLGLITDGDKGVQWKKITALGLNHIIDSIVVTDDYGRENWKPSPFPFRKIMEELNIKRGEELVYVGDNPQKDFWAARSLGWTTIQVKRTKGMFRGIIPEKGWEADIIVNKLSEIPAALEL